MTPVLSLNAVVKRYDGKRVLSGVTFSAGKAEAIGIIGPNGAGKTTLLRMIAGLIRPDSGWLRLAGEPVENGLARTPVGYFAGESTLPPSVRGSNLA